MNKLPIGEHLVCVIATQFKAVSNGNAVALTMQALSGPHVGTRHIERYVVQNDNLRAEDVESMRLLQVTDAVGIEYSDLVKHVRFRPFIVRLAAGKGGWSKVRSVEACYDHWRVDAEAACYELAVKAASAPPPPSDPARTYHGLHISTVADVQAVKLNWLWPQRFAMGKVSIIAGDPGLGKSQLSNFIIAAVTNGGEWPNGEGRAEQGDVIMLSCEDDLADTIRPRLEAAGADLRRVHVISAVAGEGGRRRGFNLGDDVAKLEEALEELGTRAKVIVIDPITAYMPKGIDSDKATAVRDALNPVQDLAARFGVAIICVSHPPKGAAAGKAINAVIGSQAYVAATRATWFVTKDPDDESRRLMLQVKNNLGNARGLAFRIATRSLPTGEAPLVVFEPGYVDTSADDAIKGNPQPKGLGRSLADKARLFLHHELAAGPQRAADLVAKAAELHGIPERTLQRAADDIHLVKRKDGMQGGWMWGFPIAPADAAAMLAGMLKQ